MYSPTCYYLIPRLLIPIEIPMRWSVKLIVITILKSNNRVYVPIVSGVAHILLFLCGRCFGMILAVYVYFLSGSLDYVLCLLLFKS